MKQTQNIQRAIDRAIELHKWQTRKLWWDEYSAHPISVSTILSRYTDNEDAIIAGLMHDTLEDVKDYKYDDLKKEFGKTVAMIVEEVSEDKDPNINEDERATWKDRKLKYIHHLKQATEWAMLVCAADKIDNIKWMIKWYEKEWDDIWNSFNASPENKIWFYWEIVRILQKRLKNSIVYELTDVYAEYIDKTWYENKHSCNVCCRKTMEAFGLELVYVIHDSSDEDLKITQCPKCYKFYLKYAFDVKWVPVDDSFDYRVEISAEEAEKLKKMKKAHPSPSNTYPILNSFMVLERNPECKIYWYSWDRITLMPWFRDN